MLHSWKLSYYSSIILSFLLSPKLYWNICLTLPGHTRLGSLCTYTVEHLEFLCRHSCTYIHIHVVLIVRVRQIMVLPMYVALYKMLLTWDFSVVELVNFLFRKFLLKLKFTIQENMHLGKITLYMVASIGTIFSSTSHTKQLNLYPN